MALCLRSPLLAELGFRHGFSLRTGGVSTGPYASLNLGRNVGDDPNAVTENLRRMGEGIGFVPGALCEVNQVHGGTVLSAAGAHGRDADALVSDAAPIGIRVADCVAVLIADPESGAVAAAHAGWRGVVAKVVPSAVRALAELRGSAPERLAAAVFPCIGPRAFEVGDDVAQQIAEAVGPEVVLRGHEKPHVDLQRAVQLQLSRAGVADGNIELVFGCTFSEPTAFFSYRRDGGVTGRHLAVILPRC